MKVSEGTRALTARPNRAQRVKNMRQSGAYPRRIYTPAEIAAICHFGQATVYRLIASGELRALRIGKIWRVSAEALEAFICERDGAA